MRSLRAWAVRVLALFRGDSVDRDLRAELESHLQLHADDNVRAGMSPAAARRAAALRLGGIEAVRERQRDRAGVPPLQHVGRDVGYAVRILRRHPSFTVVTVLTLALGIGANTSIFTVVNAVLLRPLPYHDADRLTMIWATDSAAGTHEMSISYPDFEAWRTGTRSFEALAAFTSRPATLGGGDQPELVPAVQTTPEFFRVLQVPALAGRTFGDADAASGAPATAVLSDAAWRRQFGGRGDIIGHTITVNRRPHVVIGVVAAAMHFIPTASEQVYTLLPRETDRRHLYLRTVARLRAGVTVAAAQSEMDVVASRLAAEFPQTNATTGARVVSLASAVGAPVRSGLLVLLALVAAVLLIACTNVANLLLARHASRQHELALRISLGAGRGRIVQQLVTESLVLALAGGAVGLLIAVLLTRALVALLADGVPVPRLETIAIDSTVLAFVLVTAIATGLFFGVVPALVATPRQVTAAARESGRASTRRGGRTRGALVVLETALALALLAAAGMLTRTFLELRGTAPGFVADDVAVIGGRMPPTLAPGPPRQAFFEQVRARLESQPGVISAGFVTSLPMGGSSDSLQFRLVDAPGAAPASARFNIAGPGYFRTMQIPIRTGREFTSSDTATAPGAVVINETAARRFWPGRDPIGRRIMLTGRPDAFTVVGVTGDVRQSDLGTAPRPEIFLCGLQDGPDWPAFALVVRTAGDPEALITAARAAVRAVNGDVAIATVGTMEEVLAGRLAQPRIYTLLLGAFALLALVLAAVGLYGVVSYSVAQRTRELGIRLALGSSPASLVGGVMRHAAALTAVGVGIGLGGGYLATRVVATLLPGSRPGDPLTLAAVAVLMLVVGATASYLPARRAARIDPLTALRAE